MSGKPTRDGRRGDALRRRQRVLTAISDATRAGDEVTVSAIARHAGVDRTYLYRHRDLLAKVHAAATTPPHPGNTHAVSRLSLHADLANAEARNARLVAHNRQLEKKLSELLGQQAWRESGLGAPVDIDTLQRRITELEQQTVALQTQLTDRTDELAAARAANRELMTQLNTIR